MGADIGEFLAGVRVFHQLHVALLEQVAGIAQVRTYEAGDIIVPQSGLGVDLFVVRSGAVEAVQDQNGQSVRLRTMRPGEVFGEIAILEQRPRTATVRALAPSTCVVINGLTLRRGLEKSPQTLREFEATVAERLSWPPTA